MATSKRSYTPPKGRPTNRRGEGRGLASRIPPLFEWILVALVLVALMVVAWYFSVRDDGGTPHTGAPAATIAVLDASSP